MELFFEGIRGHADSNSRHTESERYEVLKDCLDSLRRQTRTDFSVILIDNGSTDGSADYVTQNYPGVRVERFSENRGFAVQLTRGSV